MDSSKSGVALTGVHTSEPMVISTIRQSDAVTRDGAKKPGSRSLRPFHRIAGTIIGIFTLYFAVTGSMIQMDDLRALISHAPATNLEMMEIRESQYGPVSNYQVIKAADFAAVALPQDYDFGTALTTVLKSARSAVGNETPLRYVELRVIDGRPVGVVQAPDRVLRFDAATGASLEGPARAARQPHSVHYKIKLWHDLKAIGNGMTWLDPLVGIGLFVMVVTGLVLYFQLLRARSGSGLKAMFWFGGGWWRSLHRWVAVIAAILVLFVSVTGTLLSIDNFALAMYELTHKSAPKYSQFPIGMGADYSSPLPDSKLSSMLQTTLSAYRSRERATPVENILAPSPLCMGQTCGIKVLRLRYFVGYPQGVIVAGNDNDTRQLVFNSESGKRMSMKEPGYPYVVFPFGWEEHIFVKKIHRGDIFGLPGRLIDLLAGFSIIFLSISGLVMYLDLWRRRRRGGSIAMFWT